MSIITSKHFTFCSNCNEITKKYYYEIGFNGIICMNCLCTANRGFPEEKDEYIPCKYCIEPYIIWHKTENSLGEYVDKCVIHNKKKIISSDSIDSYLE